MTDKRIVLTGVAQVMDENEIELVNGGAQVETRGEKTTTQNGGGDTKIVDF